MGLINILLGAKKGARTIAEIEAALARLVSERNIAKEAIASALAERNSLLLEDKSDARIGKLDTSTDKARLTVERCDKLEPILLRELATVKGAAKAAKWQELRSRYDSASTDFVHKARAAIAALRVVVANTWGGPRDRLRCRGRDVRGCAQYSEARLARDV